MCSRDYCIPSRYDKLEPPFKTKKPLLVKISIDKVRILEFDDIKFTVSLSMFLGVQWREPRLFGPSKASNKKSQV